MGDNENHGIPIYLDPVKRRIVSADTPDDKAIAWYPSNPPARRLWACVEILRDINDLLEDGSSAKNAGKRKRKAKFIAGQVHSLAKATDQLLSTIIGARDVRKNLGTSNIEQLKDLKREFSSFVPFEWNKELTHYRNKLVSHFDDAFWPHDASKMLESIATYKIGYWLHACLHIILDVTKLNIYMWSCDTGHKDYLSFMTNEPYIVTMKVGDEGGEGAALVGVDIANESPRNSVPEIIAISIEHSQWMFKKGQNRIRGLKEDSKERWNTFKESRSMYGSEI